MSMGREKGRAKEEKSGNLTRSLFMVTTVTLNGFRQSTATSGEAREQGEKVGGSKYSGGSRTSR